MSDGRSGPDVEAAAAVLAAAVGDRLRRSVPLGPLTTYRVGGSAALFVEAAGPDDLAAVARARVASGLPVLVLGKGSNMLVADRGFAGIVVSLDRCAAHVVIGPVGAPGEPCTVVAGAAVALPVLARRTAAAGITGFEWAVGVPGSVGGAVRMNAGGHGSDMAASLTEVVVLDLDRPDDGPLRRPASSLGLAFRSSALRGTEVVYEATLGLCAGDRQRAEDEIAQIVRWRRDHQPGGQNCGSVFVNPVPGEVAAGALIDDLGLRGLRIGTAFVSEKHANFIQATEGGSAADVRAVIELVRRRVAEATGHHLRSEVQLVGFEPSDGGGGSA